MYNKINWKKSFFSSNYELFANNEKIGFLYDKSFSQKAKAEINGKKYRFETKGFFNQSTDIYDDETDTRIGVIIYNSFKTKADIEFFGQKKYTWKTKSTWNTNGVIYHSDLKMVDFSGSMSKGEIEINEYNDLLVLTGLFVSNYYWQTMIAVFVAVFIPIWISVIN